MDIMSSKVHRFSVGSFECIAAIDGTYAYPQPCKDVFINFFSNAPEPELRQALASHNITPDQWDEYVSPYTCLVIKGGSDHTLIDTGAGQLAPTTGKLITNLKVGGIDPTEIDTVIITHAHPDHIGGNVDGEGKPAFLNADYVIWKDEWDFWTVEPDLSGLRVDDHGKEILVKVAKDALSPIRDYVNLIEKEEEIKPGIRLISAPGHTPGHMAVKISSRGSHLYFVADAFLHPVHVEHPEWHSSVAYEPEKVTASRHNLIKEAVSKDAPIMTTHFHFPGLGRIVKKQEKWQWQLL